MIATAPSRDDPATMTCPLCQAYFTPVGRQIYCSTACRKAAFRRRQQSPAATVTIPAAPNRPERPRPPPPPPGPDATTPSTNAGTAANGSTENTAAPAAAASPA